MGNTSSTLSTFVNKVILAINSPQELIPTTTNDQLKLFIAQLKKISAFESVEKSYALAEAEDGKFFCLAVVTEQGTVILTGEPKNKRTWKVRSDLIAAIISSERKIPFGDNAVFFLKRDLLRLILAGVTTTMPPNHILESACSRFVQNNFVPVNITGNMFDELDVINKYNVTPKELTDDLQRKINTRQNESIFRIYFVRANRTKMVDGYNVPIKYLARDTIREICGENENYELFSTSATFTGTEKIKTQLSEETLEAIRLQEKERREKSKALAEISKPKGNKNTSRKSALDELKDFEPRIHSFRKRSDKTEYDSSSEDPARAFNELFNEMREEYGNKGGKNAKGAKGGRGKGGKNAKGGKGGKNSKNGKNKWDDAPIAE